MIDAPPEKILDALADVSELASWSPVHKRIEVLDKYEDGRPHHVLATIKILGLVDKEILEYHWGPDWMVWDAKATAQQRAQHVEYTLTREGPDSTRVRFDITVEPGRPMPAFIVRRASESALDGAEKGLRELLMRGNRSAESE